MMQFLIFIGFFISQTSSQTYVQYVALTHPWYNTTVCLSGDYLVNMSSSLSMCVTCGLGCAECCDSNLCTQCQTGFYLNRTQSLCQRCPGRCNKCIVQYVTSLQNVSNSNSSDDSGNSTANSTVLQNVTTAQLFCTVCMDGYTRNPNDGMCTVSCLQGCQNCDDVVQLGKCNQCLNGYYLKNSNTSCGYCPSGCATCVSRPDMVNQFTCSSCSDQFYYQNDQCLVCPLGCKKCTSATNCTVCEDSAYWMNGTICSKCVDKYCQYCANSKGSCYACYLGFALNPVTKQCLNCTQLNCQSCNYDSVNNCSQCRSGYAVQYNGTCSQCSVPQCLNCSSINNCSQCQDYFFLFNASSTSNATCQSCISNCITCDNNSTCLKCRDSFYLNPSTLQCTACIDNCNSCSNSSWCNLCYQGYYFDGYKCKACDSGCQQCTSAGNCQVCYAGFYSSLGYCLKCNGDTCKCSQYRQLVQTQYNYGSITLTLFTCFLLLIHIFINI